MKFGPNVSVNEVFDAMSEGEKCHMANKLYKNGFEPIKMRQQLDKALEGSEEGFLATLSEEELAHIWHRCNIAQSFFVKGYAENDYSSFAAYKQDRADTYTVWTKVDTLLMRSPHYEELTGAEKWS